VTQVLQALVLSVWTAMGVHSPEAPVISEAIAAAVVVEANAGRAPILGSFAEDTALAAVFAAHESNVSARPKTLFSWDARGGISCSYLQIPCALARQLSLVNQATYWFALLREGVRLCPGHPAAPLSGGCRGLARRISDRRVLQMRALLGPIVLRSSPDPQSSINDVSLLSSQ
jgi:hypothetical protein